MHREKLEQHLREKFGGKYTVAYWETIPHEECGEDVIHVGLAKADLTLAEAQDLPTEIDGVKIVYEYSGEIKLLTHRYYDPLIGGISIGAVDVTAGTYGGVVYDGNTDEPYLLTNEHVVSDTSNNDPRHPPEGHPIVQPGAIDGGVDVAGNLARVGGMKQAALNGEPCDIDAALIQPVRSFHASKYFELNHVEPLKHAPVKIGDRIVKVGRTTGVTYAEVGAVEVSANIGGITWQNPITMENLIMTKESFVEGGDSGSRVWEVEQMQPVGLVFAGSWLTSMIIPAETICKKFNVEFCKASVKEDEDDPDENSSDEEGGGEDEVENETPIWKMKEFWLPIITGIATAIALVIELGTGIVVEVATIVSLGVFILSIFLGVDWAQATLLRKKVLNLATKVKNL